MSFSRLLKLAEVVCVVAFESEAPSVWILLPNLVMGKQAAYWGK
jgi:hypothetical protein